MTWSTLGRVAAAILLAAFALGYLLPMMRFDLNPYDEGIMALGAEQVLKGRRPNIDFYTPYPPGVYYALAAAYRLAGVRLIVERAFSVGLIAACTALGCLLVTGLRPREARRTIPELLGVVVILAIAGVCFGLIWVTPVTGGALCLLLLAGLALRAALRARRPLAGLGVGVVFGLAALWRPGFALYGLTGAVVVWLLGPEEAAPAAEKKPRWRRLRGAVALLLGSALVGLPVFGWVVALGGERAFKSLFVWPIVSTQLATLPWPALLPKRFPSTLARAPFLRQAAFWCQNWAYFFPLAAGALGLWRLGRWRALAPSEINIGLWLLVTAIAFFPYASHRTDYIHLLPLLLFALLFSALCLGSALAERPAKRSWPRILWLLLGLTLATPALAALLPTPLDDRAKTPSPTSRTVHELPGRRGGGILAPFRFSRQYRDIITYLNAAVLPGERIYSGTSRHDVFMVNDIMLYFLSERDPGTYFWCVDAGVTTDAEVQRQMIAEMSANQINWIVLWTAARPDLNSPTSRAPGAKMLDQAIAMEFVPVDWVGWYGVLRRVAGGATPPR